MELLHFENGDRMIADVYGDHIKLRLIISKEDIIIYDDTRLFLVNLYKEYFLDTKKMELDASLKNVNLGILLNIYYFRIANDMELNKKFSCSNVYGDWIGTRYCCFENNNIATWIYFTDGRFVFKCTPLYEGLFDDYDITFKKFIDNYREYKNDFSCYIYKEFIHNLKAMILAL